MLKKLALFVLGALMLANPCMAAENDFSDSNFMFNHVLELMDEHVEESAKDLLAYSQQLLREAEEAEDASFRRETAASAWFAAVYAQMRNSLPFPPKDKSLDQDIAASLDKAASLLGFSSQDKKIKQDTIDFLNGKLPDNCGINKGSVPITGDINMIIIDDGIGNKRNLYYHTGKEGNDCGRVTGSLCYKILNKMPVTPLLRQSGVQGDSMTFIEECVRPD